MIGEDQGREMPDTAPKRENLEADQGTRAARPRRWLTGDRLQRHALLLAWIVMSGVSSILRPDTFATTANFRTIFGTQSVQLILTLALLLPLVVGEFDLSIAPTMGFSSMVLAVLTVNHHWATGPAVLVALASGLVFGTVNAILVVKVGVNAFIATLGVGTVATGITFAISDYTVVSGISPTVVTAVSSNLLGIQVSFFYAIALVIVIWYILRFTPLGRHMLFIGDNAEAARLCGIPVSRLRMGAFIWCGLLSAVAGIVLSGVLGSADPNARPICCRPMRRRSSALPQSSLGSSTPGGRPSPCSS